MFPWLLTACSSSDEEENTDDPTIYGTITYDVPPENFTGYVYRYPNLSKEYWATLKNLEEMIEATTVPEKELKKMSTEGLSHCCMYWPLYGNYGAYPTTTRSIYDGINLMIGYSNALQALALRDEGGKALMKLYKFFPAFGNRVTLSWDFSVPMDEYLNSLHKCYIELLLTTEYFTPQMDKATLEELGWLIENMLEKIINDENYNSWNMLQYSYALWQRVLLCYDDLTGGSLLTAEERKIFENNIKYLGIFGQDLTRYYVSLIDTKKKTVLGIK